MKFLLIGEDINHSISPTLHNIIYSQLGLSYSYEAKNIGLDSVDSIIDQLKSNQINGINITFPYKNLLFDKVDLLDSTAENVGSINCISSVNGKLKAYNTDIYGFERLIENNKVQFNSKRILVLGSGGAAKAICSFLKNQEIMFCLYNRSITHANALCKMINYELAIDVVRSIDSMNFDIIINCLSRDIDPVCILKKIGFNHKKLDYFIDINYNMNYSLLNRIDTKFTIDGLDMLIYQAVKSNEIWMGNSILDKIDLEAIRNYLLEIKC